MEIFLYKSSDVAERIKNLAKARGVIIKDMLSDLTLGANTLSNMRHGRMLSSDSLARIADYFNVSVDYLLGRETEKTEQPTEYGELSAEIISIFEQLTPDNRAKLLELCHLYLDAQHKNGENA